MAFLLNPHRFGSGPFSPTDIADLSWWIDPSDSATVTGSAPVTQVTDKTGNGNHLVQVTGRNLPDLVSSGGLDWLSFNGTDETMRVTSTAASQINFGSGEWTIFIVVDPTTSVTGIRTALNKGSNVGGRYKAGINQTSTGDWRGFMHDGTSGYSVVAGSGSQNGNPHLFCVQRDNAANLLRTWADGAVLTTVNIAGAGDIDETSGSGWVATLLVGSAPSGVSTTEHWSGLIGEILFYKRALSASQRQDVETYLIDKWGI